MDVPGRRRDQADRPAEQDPRHEPNDLSRYEQDRIMYDQRYGDGAFMRYYGSRPEAYDEHYGDGAYERDFGENHSNSRWDD